MHNTVWPHKLLKIWTLRTSIPHTLTHKYSTTQKCTTHIHYCIHLVKWAQGNYMCMLCSLQALGTWCLIWKMTDLHIMCFQVCAHYKENLSYGTCPSQTCTQSYTLTILVLTSFSMALTSSAALGTSEDDCRDVSKDEDWERKRRG